MLERTELQPDDVDTCMTMGAGHPMGPLKLLDFVGLDVAVAIGDGLHRDSGAAEHRLPSCSGGSSQTESSAARAAPASTSTRPRAGNREMLAHRAFGSGFARARLALAATFVRTKDFAGSGRPHRSQTTSASDTPWRFAVRATSSHGSSASEARPSGQVECLERALERRAEVLLRAEQRPQDLELLIGEPDYPHPLTPPRCRMRASYARTRTEGWGPIGRK